MDQPNHWADRVLIDAPCSGLGTLKRNPEIKWSLTQEQLKDLLQAQRDLMLKGAAMLRPGGALIYATCSILPCENQEQTAWFLDENPYFRLDGEKIHFPARVHLMGFIWYVWSKKKKNKLFPSLIAE